MELSTINHPVSKFLFLYFGIASIYSQLSFISSAGHILVYGIMALTVVAVSLTSRNHRAVDTTHQIQS
jgi:hypothetical protein